MARRLKVQPQILHFLGLSALVVHGAPVVSNTLQPFSQRFIEVYGQRFVAAAAK
jgi:hypothetical protein